MNKILMIDIAITVVSLFVSAGIGWYTARTPLPIIAEVLLCIFLINIWVYVIDIMKKHN